MNPVAKLAAVREQMTALQVDVLVVPSEDAHMSEYTPLFAKRRAYLSGFTGSAGTAVVAHDWALLWTDGRYYLQAERELDADAGWKLMKAHVEPPPEKFLAQTLTEPSSIGFCASVTSLASYGRFAAALFAPGNAVTHTPVLLDTHPVDTVWETDGGTPPKPSNTLRALATTFAGLSHTDKITALAATLTERGFDAMLVSALDEVAWLFNIRGDDIDFNPVVIAYALVSADGGAQLFVDAGKVDDAARAHLGDSVAVRDYADIIPALEGIRGSKVWLDARSCNCAVFTAVTGETPTLTSPLVQQDTSPVCMAKAIKNETELACIRTCHVRDGEACVRYLAWLEAEIAAGASHTEVTVADHLASLRADQDHFVSLSFETISSSGPNGAVIHYSPTEEVCAPIDPDAVYLCDSGGQYLDGTTDVTRCRRFGTPTAFERRCYTRVLQGHIALDTAVFPEGTTGYQLDILARTGLWRDGLDYRHGTGHGVGAFLCVHEGPHGISFRPTSQKEPLRAGMTVTNEPGYYHDGEFGFRIENVMLVVPADTPNQFGDKPYLAFEHVTLVPLCAKLIDLALLSDHEIAWVDAYHAKVLEAIAPRVQDDPQVLAWLQHACLPLADHSL